jgi:hypothetical protein
VSAAAGCFLEYLLRKARDMKRISWRSSEGCTNSRRGRSNRFLCDRAAARDRFAFALSLGKSILTFGDITSPVQVLVEDDVLMLRATLLLCATPEAPGYHSVSVWSSRPRDRPAASVANPFGTLQRLPHRGGAVAANGKVRVKFEGGTWIVIDAGGARADLIDVGLERRDAAH